MVAGVRRDCTSFGRAVQTNLRAGIALAAGMALILFVRPPMEESLSMLVCVYAYHMSSSTHTIGGHLRNGVGLLYASIITGVVCTIFFSIFMFDFVFDKHSSTTGHDALVTLGVFIMVWFEVMVTDFSKNGISKGFAVAITVVFFVATYFGEEPQLRSKLFSCWRLQLNTLYGIALGWGSSMLPW